MSAKLRCLSVLWPPMICLGVLTVGYGQQPVNNETAPAKPAGVTDATAGETSASEQENAEDREFESLVDLALLGKAWGESDAAILTDCALQFAEAERTLSRRHSAVRASQLLGLAARMAGIRQDKTTLDRLAKVADKMGDGKLAEQVTQARKTAARDPADDLSNLSVSVDALSPDAFGLYQNTLKAVEAAQLGGNPKSLDNVKRGVAEAPSLDDEQRKQLLRVVADAQTAIKPQGGDVGAILDKLTGQSRQVTAAVGNAIFNNFLSPRQRAAIRRAGRRGGLVQIRLPRGRRVIDAVAPGGVVLTAIPRAAYRLPLPVNIVNLRRFPPRIVFGPLGIPFIGGRPFINLGGLFPNLFRLAPGARFVTFLGRRFPLLRGSGGLVFFNGPSGNRIVVQRGTTPATAPPINLTSRLWLENLTVPSGSPRVRRAYLLTGSGTSGNFQTWLEQEDSFGSAAWRRRADGGGERTGTFTFSSNVLNLSQTGGQRLLSFTIGYVDAKTLRRGLNGEFVFWYGFGGTPAARGQVAAYVR